MDQKKLWIIVTSVILIVIILIVIIVWFSFRSTCELSTPTGIVVTPLSDNKVEFSWEAVMGADVYCIYIATDENVSPSSASQCLTIIKTVTIPYVWVIPEITEIYYFVITAKNSVCESEPCEVYQIDLTCQTPSAPVLTNDTEIVMNNLFVAWFPIESAETYTIYLKSQASGPDPGPDNFDSKITVEHPTWFYVQPLPLSSDPWFITVTASDACGESEPSETFSE